jgi:hypothetical protein
MMSVMIINKRKIYESLLNAESDARQIRSAKNKVIASNDAANNLFGSTENPFAFLKNATPTSSLQKLIDAYCNASPLDIEIKTPESVFDISL